MARQREESKAAEAWKLSNGPGGLPEGKGKPLPLQPNRVPAGTEAARKNSEKRPVLEGIRAEALAEQFSCPAIYGRSMVPFISMASSLERLRAA